MFFLIRMSFWLVIVLALLPTGSSQPQASGGQIDAMDTMIAAGAAVSDMSGFCDRQPDACKVGAQTAVAIGHRAQAGASMVYDFFQERIRQDAPAQTASVPEAKPVPAAMKVPAQPGSQSTLRASDLEPAWHGAAPRKETVPMPRPRPKSA